MFPGTLELPLPPRRKDGNPAHARFAGDIDGPLDRPVRAAASSTAKRFLIAQNP